MNMIEELINKSLDIAVPYTWTTLDYDEIMKLQKTLAKLIVSECIGQINKIPVRAESLGGQTFNYIKLETAIETLEEHFGVTQ